MTLTNHKICGILGGMMSEPVNIVDVMAQEALKNCFKKWGIEKTEEKIREICLPRYPQMYDVHMRNYKQLINGGHR